MSASPVSSDGLKRLQPVVDVAERSASTGTQLYGAAKARLPEPVQARVEQVEQRVGATAAPLLHKAQDTGAFGAGAGHGGGWGVPASFWRRRAASFRVAHRVGWCSLGLPLAHFPVGPAFSTLIAPSFYQ